MYSLQKIMVIEASIKNMKKISFQENTEFVDIGGDLE